MNVIKDLLNYKLLSLEERLQLLKKQKLVQTQYRVSQRRKQTETNEQYIARIQKEAMQQQFVAVPFDGKEYYVAFGIPGPIITKYGTFLLIPAIVVGGEWGTHYILFYPDLETLKKEQLLLVKISSGCYSGMVLGDTTCDCKQQLDLAEKMCVENKSGMVIEIPKQDGRGWGEYKMANQRLMDELDFTTMEAAQAFYADDTYIDRRTYDECAIILRAFGFKPNQGLDLATNNPAKVKAFGDLGFRVKNTKAIIAPNLTASAKRNLASKLKKWHKKVTI